MKIKYTHIAVLGMLMVSQLINADFLKSEEFPEVKGCKSGYELEADNLLVNDGLKTVQPKLANTKPSNWKPDRQITLRTLPGLKFNEQKINVKKGANIEITLINTDVMPHNIVVMKPGDKTPNDVGMMAMKLGAKGMKMNYVPDTDLVLHHSSIVKPKTKETIYFKAPIKTGHYWIVCTFPGHSYTMRTQFIIE